MVDIFSVNDGNDLGLLAVQISYFAYRSILQLSIDFVIDWFLRKMGVIYACLILLLVSTKLGLLRLNRAYCGIKVFIAAITICNHI